MIGAPPPADATGPFQNKFVKALTGLLATILIGALFGIAQRSLAPSPVPSGSRPTSMTSSVFEL